jgi:hypothetical protein
MTAETIKDVRISILLNLYRVRRRGRTVRGLHVLIQPSVPSCEPEDVQGQVQFLLDKQYIEVIPGDALAANDEPFFAITDLGCSYCEKQHYI